MRRSETSIRTSHAGRLPAVGIATNAAKGAGSDSATPQVVEVIKKQIQIGIDVSATANSGTAVVFSTMGSNSAG